MDSQVPGPSRDQPVASSAPVGASNKTPVAMTRVKFLEGMGTVAKGPRPDIDFSDRAALEAYVEANLDAFLESAGEEVPFLSSGNNHQMRFYEMRERELLRELYVQKEMVKDDIYRRNASLTMSLPKELADMKLYTLIQKADNAPNFPEMKERLLDGFGNDLDDSVQSWESLGSEAAVTDAVEVPVSAGGHVSPVGGQGAVAQGQGSRDRMTFAVPAPVNPQPVIDGGAGGAALPTTPTRNSTDSSEDIFQTPYSHLDGTRSRTEAQGQAGGFFNAAPTGQGRAGSPAHIFQFYGHPSKEPRWVKPGEVLFSATGSPIRVPPIAPPSSLAPPPGGSEASTTPPQGKPIRVKIDNPNGHGPSVDVELVCRGAGQAEQEVFRNFMTDFRGFMTTRSMAQNKVMGPRIPTSGKYGKRSYASSAKKPAWRV